MYISDGHLVVAIAGSTPQINVYDMTTMQLACRPLSGVDEVGVESRDGIPVVAIQGRLMAYTTPESVSRARDDAEKQAKMEEPKYGTIVTDRSVKRALQRRQKLGEAGRPWSADSDTINKTRSSPLPTEPPGSFSPPSVQSLVFGTAAGISSEVGKGVWSGLKYVGNAAMTGASKSEMLSKSAPVISDFAKRFSGEVHAGKEDVEPRAPAGRASSSNARTGRYAKDAASWVKIVDLGRMSKTRRPPIPNDPVRLDRPVVLAHFALPIMEPVPINRHTSPGIDILSFSPLGTHLALGTCEGKSIGIVEIRLNAPMTMAEPSRSGVEADSQPRGQVWLRYELRRGLTPARITQMVWSRGGDLISVASRKTLRECDSPDLTANDFEC